METENTAKKNLDCLQYQDKTIYLVGTAHISTASADLAEETIREYQPDSVAVELCKSRYDSLQDPDRWKNTDIISIIRQGKSYVLLAQLILAGFQKKLGDYLKVKPGEDMMRSVKIAEEVGSEIVLADRDVKTTLKRTWSNLGFWSMLKVLGAMIASIFTSEKLEEDEIERLKSEDALNELMKDFSETLPEVKKSLITERDQYLAHKIRTAPGKKIVGVVGAGHVPGIKEWIEKEIPISELEIIPKGSKLKKIIAWSIPLLVVAVIIYGFFRGGAETSKNMILAWIVINAGFGALGALIALAHPITIISAGLASPLTSINPFIAGGWVAGIVEASIRKPRVGDLENIASDVASVSGFYKNRVTKILMIIALTNIFGSIGTFLGIGKLVSM